MKKILLLITTAVFLFAGCEKKFDNVINTTDVSYQVKNLKTIPNYEFSTIDSSLTLSLEFSSSTGVKSVVYDMYSSDGVKIGTGNMYDDGNAQNGDEVKGDNIFSGKVLLRQSYPNGNYLVEYSVEEQTGITRSVAKQSFVYNNMIDDKPPLLENLVMPDSIGAETQFIYTVKASDPNGLNDIKYVYFEAFRPDGSQVSDNNGATKLVMVDNGDSEHFGDAVGGDGIYSYKNEFSATAQKGNWRFEFSCFDRSGVFSNKIIHIIKVK